jgi:hypothetical protein
MSLDKIKKQSKEMLASKELKASTVFATLDGNCFLEKTFAEGHARNSASKCKEVVIFGEKPSWYVEPGFFVHESDIKKLEDKSKAEEAEKKAAEEAKANREAAEKKIQEDKQAELAKKEAKRQEEAKKDEIKPDAKKEAKAKKEKK